MGEIGGPYGSGMGFYGLGPHGSGLPGEIGWALIDPNPRLPGFLGQSGQVGFLRVLHTFTYIEVRSWVIQRGCLEGLAQGGYIHQSEKVVLLQYRCLYWFRFFVSFNLCQGLCL